MVSGPTSLSHTLLPILKATLFKNLLQAFRLASQFTDSWIHALRHGGLNHLPWMRRAQRVAMEPVASDSSLLTRETT